MCWLRPDARYTAESEMDSATITMIIFIAFIRITITITLIIASIGTLSFLFSYYRISGIIVSLLQPIGP